MSAPKYIAHGGYVRKYDRCPHCGSENICYTYVVCCNDSIQYRCECADCRREHRSELYRTQPPRGMGFPGARA